jgi:simple sugar transport system permease protein
VLGESPRAGAFGGFSAKRMTIFAFAVSGALAGLAGIMEVASVIGKLQPVISPGYGFTAIIVAFLGRLNPLGILVAGFLIALTYLGGEAIQSGLQVSSKMAQVLQGMLLFYVLACDTLILYRVRLVRTPALRGEPARA